MKISIVMPTYNDASSIIETLESLKKQTYKNWQLIIMNDGSTDNLEEVLNSYLDKSSIKNNVEYYYQNNQDQLNAILNSIKYIEGDYIYILHSDDLLPSEDFFEKIIKEAKDNPDIDAFIGDLIIIDENSKQIGIQTVSQYKDKDTSLSKLMLWLGRNLYIDVMFAKKLVFEKYISISYLTWNMPFWTQLESDTFKVLNVKKVNFPILKYRIHSGNYINNEVGKLNVINGELRTLTRLMKCYNIPMYKTQFYIYRIANKLKLGDKFSPIYFNKEEKNKGDIVKFAIEKRFNETYKENLFLNAVVNFYTNKNNRIIYINIINEDEFIYKGKDMRLFNRNLLNNKLSNLYLNMIEEMNKGFNKIEVKSNEDKDKIIDITKFLCIYPYVDIEVKNSTKRYRGETNGNT
ncbi:glycosyltransferase family 2 protein [Paraclostridium sordellii]|uniref:glycosyltransferase family 2 protein n=1 Tax=Paraclostridium sordellii TaxID=1505 RepID=UPI0005DABFF7|nr:glycosyltransferase family 2 protein [Paeniclostridium sordellii]CEO12204.1 family 2 glycosyl transferase [[Clostridium] sordellii] [Paeniclostridium sordellii]CEP87786.1 family 2 glycosyl transferase [[Clostridium] sordellii] [Paeniclostridium sordellii]CEP97478.1 family 2 glycosyl transferase [[Clostridium] sordellii] [Paeniclostridium sordellii]CEQ01166.1 family 2 glycosyl transferase [[Clostridium] sordellii] [Paeniclostridium sordellii]